MSTIITLSTAYYVVKSKAEVDKYVSWMNNFFSIVKHFRLVIYTNSKSIQYIDTKENPNIRIVIKEMEDFYNYRYKDYWIKNHENNFLLNSSSVYNTGWELNMLWSEKIAFVKNTIEEDKINNMVCPGGYYGWCDIGYFRNESGDLPLHILIEYEWAKCLNINLNNKIAYGIVNNDENYISFLDTLVNNKNDRGVPVTPIPPEQVSVAAGFFLLEHQKIDWLFKTYDAKLCVYFENEYLVKDEQLILIDCILSNKDHFSLYREQNPSFNNWFMFQRILLNKNKIEKMNQDNNQFLPMITIMMPIYNGIEFIEESVGSVLSQTYTNWQLIIGINGYEKDSQVYQIANDFKDKNKDKANNRIRVYDLFDLETRGKSGALNKMLEYVEIDSEYISLLDVDDIWESDKLSTQRPFLQQRYDVVGSKCVYFGDETRKGTVPFIPTGDISSFDFLSVNPIINSSSIIKKELCYWDTTTWSFIEDYELWLRLRYLYVNKRFYNCEQVLVRHRIHNESAFNSKGNHVVAQDLVKHFRSIFQSK